MSISYQRLWKTMSERGFTKTLLAQKTGIDLTTIDYLSRNKNVTTDVIDKIGLALDCDVDKILEIVHSDGNMASKPYSVVSLFSGCGGLDLGFIGGFTFLGKEYKENPYEIIWANDFNKAACETYRANIDEKIITGPVEESFDTLPINADVVIGGFPCQDISINGKMAGVDGKRSGLYIWMVRAVERIRPKIFIAENVKALLMKRHESSLKRVINDFSNIGYNISCSLYNAADYGVPQIRERVIIVGIRNDYDVEFIPPTPTTAERRVTAKEAMWDLEDKQEDEKISHIWSLAKPSSGQGLRYLTADAPATTMRSECHGNLQFHYSLPRRISMREAARIQSFPDSFIFKAKLRETERMIGNAVAPVFAWYIANSVSNTLQKMDGGE